MDDTQNADGTQNAAGAANGRTVDDSPRVTAEEAALAARIVRGTAGDLTDRARENLCISLDAVANYNG